METPCKNLDQFKSLVNQRAQVILLAPGMDSNEAVAQYKLCQKVYNEKPSSKWKERQHMNIKTYKTSDMSLRLLHIKKKLTFLIIVFLIVFITSFIVGRYPLTINQLLDFFALEIFDISKDVPDVIKTVVVNVRLPRILAAVLVGSALAASGAAYQGIFKNPLASPDILGASAGAAFGASLAIYFSCSHYGIQLTAFIFGIVSVLLSLHKSKNPNRFSSCFSINRYACRTLFHRPYLL